MRPWVVLCVGCLPVPVPPEVGDAGHDYDEDGFDEQEGDCDDDDPLRHPAADEICSDGIDNNCDGEGTGCGLWGEISAADAHATLFASDASAYAGTTLDAGGDDGLGGSGVLVGAPNADRYTGRVVLVLGAPAGTNDLATAAATYRGEADGDWFGNGVGFIGDFDGDGTGDLAIGATGAAVEVDPQTAGRVDLFSGAERGEMGTEDTIATFVGEPGAGVGSVLAGGSGELWIGAEYLDLGGPDAGGAYRIRAPSGDRSLADADGSVVGTDPESWFGGSLAGPVDIDGDGNPEILIGASGGAYEGERRGLVYVFPADLSADLTVADASARISGSQEGDAAGYSQATTDADGDGYVDLLVGAPSDVDEQRGFVYLVNGPITVDAELDYADATLLGAAPEDDLGDVVCAPGDVDGDGRGDIVVSSEDHATTDSDHGVVYVVLGGVSGTLDVADADARVVATGTQGFGKSVAGADLSGDGHADVVVGAPLSDLGLARGGAVYLYLGGAP